MKPTPEERLQRFPPIFLRLLARHQHGEAKTIREIAWQGKLDEMLALTISRLASWDTVRIADAFAFMRGCGINVFEPRDYRRLMVYVKGKKTPDGRVSPKYAHLRKSPAWQTELQPLAKEWERLIKERNP